MIYADCVLFHLPKALITSLEDSAT